MVGLYLSFLDRTPVETVKKEHRKKEQAVIARSIRFNLSESQQRLVIFLRFQSLTSNEETWHSSAEVYKATGVKRQTQHSIIKRWLQRDLKVVSHSKNSGRKQLLTKEQQAYLANPKTLQDMRHLSLAQRAHNLKRFWDLRSFGTETLRKYYLRLGVRFKKPPLYYDTKNLNAGFILNQQQEFSRNLTSILMEQEKEVIYIDETTFNLWQTPGRVWFKDGMALDIAKNRGQSISLLGALSISRGIVHYSCFKGSNNQHTFHRFIVELKRKCEG